MPQRNLSFCPRAIERRQLLVAENIEIGLTNVCADGYFEILISAP
jgi:hypothetical protein